MVINVDDDIEGVNFKLQCTFPIMEGHAVLNKSSNKIRENFGKK